MITARNDLHAITRYCSMFKKIVHQPVMSQKDIDHDDVLRQYSFVDNDKVPQVVNDGNTSMTPEESESLMTPSSPKTPQSIDHREHLLNHRISRNLLISNNGSTNEY